MVYVCHLFLPKVPPSYFSSEKALGKVAAKDELSETGGGKRRDKSERNQGWSKWWATVR